MKILCPYCNYQLDAPTPPQHRAVCPECKNKFFAAGDLVFRYGVLLDEHPVKVNRRVACPHCSQHHRVAFDPQYNMLSCVSCLKIFIIDDQEATIENCETIKLDDKSPVGNPQVETASNAPVIEIPIIKQTADKEKPVVNLPPPAGQNPAVNPPPHQNPPPVPPPAGKNPAVNPPPRPDRPPVPPPAGKNPAVNPPPRPNRPPVPPPTNRQAPPPAAANKFEEMLNNLRSKISLTESIKSNIEEFLLKITDADNAKKIVDFLDRNLIFVIAGIAVMVLIVLLIIVLVIMPAVFRREIKLPEPPILTQSQYQAPETVQEAPRPAPFESKVVENIYGEDGQEYVVMSTDPGKKNGKLKLNNVKNTTTSFFGEDGTEWIIVE